MPQVGFPTTLDTDQAQLEELELQVCLRVEE